MYARLVAEERCRQLPRQVDWHAMAGKVASILQQKTAYLRTQVPVSGSRMPCEHHRLRNGKKGERRQERRSKDRKRGRERKKKKGRQEGSQEEGEGEEEGTKKGRQEEGEGEEEGTKKGSQEEGEGEDKGTKKGRQEEVWDHSLVGKFRYNVGKKCGLVEVPCSAQREPKLLSSTMAPTTPSTGTTKTAFSYHGLYLTIHRQKTTQECTRGPLPTFHTLKFKNLNSQASTKQDCACLPSAVLRPYPTLPYPTIHRQECTCVSPARSSDRIAALGALGACNTQTHAD